MNIKEIGEIRRRVRRDRSNMTAIYGCYVNMQLTDGAGNQVASAQVQLPVPTEQEQITRQPAVLTREGEFLVAEGSGFAYRFSTHYGTFVSLVVNGAEQLASPMSMTTFPRTASSFSSRARHIMYVV